ncbi:MAG TPA: hypothetical protein VGM28_11265 [Candidatus Limnocylindrales bacterium]|jgi:hypothetical protein
MTAQVTVWVDRAALAMETRVGRAVEQRTPPEAAAAMGHLVNAGCCVVLLGPMVEADVDGLGYPGVEQADTLPLGAAGWLVTVPGERHAEARAHRGLRTIVVGPATSERGLAQRPFDDGARDLLDAALIVLTADAMPDTVLAATG